jgi:hypothetical protein
MEFEMRAAEGAEGAMAGEGGRRWRAGGGVFYDLENFSSGA